MNSYNVDRRSFLVCVIAFYIFAMPLFSQKANQNLTEKTVSQESELQENSAPDPDLANLTPLTSEMLDKKKEGFYFTGMPLVNFNSDEGFGFGIGGFLYYNGHKNDKYFKYEPYQAQIYLQAFFTTTEVSEHEIKYDFPFFLKSLFFLNGKIKYKRKLSENFFGNNEKSMGNVSIGSQEYTNMDEYLTDLSLPENGFTNKKYHNYENEYFEWFSAFTRKILGGIICPSITLGARYDNIRDYSNQTVKLDNGDTAIQQTTMLREYYNRGELTGFTGGFSNYLAAGIALDTRDYSPNPKNGMYHTLSYRHSGPYFGSTYQYGQAALKLQFYYSPFKHYQNLTFAFRTIYSIYHGNPPFYLLNTIEGQTDFLGGTRSLRGYISRRFTGKAISIFNFEIRESLFGFQVFKQDFQIILAPFLDVGRVFDSIESTRLEGYRASYGAGVRIAWNQATVIMIDLGFSSEDSGIYIDFRHIF